ncbi:kinesin family protein [Neofusicoccum parvum]|uniref:Kinesin family protein n=1 Tax=Neofusicoccum parvum TaxID=310453 RepID=A0ACB5S7N4_9PEZI|nr:kinesin family protein [Neofusicoccum parvum]GME44037.1 kinesin family protein [Neofusicoccum parvum]
MYSFLELRRREVFATCCALLEAAMDPRAHRTFSYGFESHASAPSLRAVEPHQPAAKMSDDAGNVKVVVRCRAFVRREHERGAECLIRMDPATQTTVLLPPNDSHDPANSRASSRKVYEEKSFTFDKSFWSHSEADAHYAHQDDVYSSFGEEFLDHNFEGYHTCIFAYGQTGSGKSYTMMGTPEQPGLIPRTCEALFDRINNEPSPNTTYSVHVSYFEVYNEHVRDLLSQRTSPSIYLKIRESQTDGVYVQGLTDAPVRSYADVERLMKTGDLNRTTASTKMNDTSSRSHAVFTINLKQMQHSLLTDETIERSARMRLVDLAGSERAKSTEATGQRLVEGGKINKSLTTLGRVIAALAQNGGSGSTADGRPRSGHSKKRELVPYRDSVLTWLLKDSLGGNSKTAMVACIAPADYDETLSTLRYADQAKRIRTRATVNQDSMSSAQRDAQIAAMAEQIRHLQTSVNASTLRRQQAEAAELEDYQRRVEVMQRLMEETRQVSEAKIKALTAEVEELRPVNQTLRAESEALRRHLALALGELKNPIVLPPIDGLDLYGGLEEEQEEIPLAHEKENEANAGRKLVEEEDSHELLAAELQSHADDFLKDLGLFRRKVNDDFTRFGSRSPLADVVVN